MINFLISNHLSSAPEGIMGAISKGFRTLCFDICTTVYQAIIYVYNIFDKLCKSRFLDNQIIESFSERIGVILGLVMAFIVIFSLIKMVLDPDKLNDKEMGAGALIKKIIITIVLLGISNYMFNLLYLVQKTVIESDAISKLLLPIQIDEEQSDNFGNILAIELLSSFYYVDTEPSHYLNDEVPADFIKCGGLVDEFKNQIVEAGNFQLGYQCLNDVATVETDTEMVETFVLTYNPLFSVVVGIIVLYLLFVYCINVGVRMIQLMFLEIIAPMAIISYVSPKKDTMFSKWTKIYIATYIDVFIRIAIINFVVFIIAAIFSSFSSTENGFLFGASISGENGIVQSEKNFIIVIIVIALLTFAKKAPELLKEILPKGDSKLGFGMSSPKQLFDAMLGGSTIRKGLTTGAKVATAGAAIGLLSSIASGRSRYVENKRLGAKTGEAVRAAAFGGFTAFGSGLLYGGKNGIKGIKKGLEAQTERDNKYLNLRRKGGTVKGALKAKTADLFGDSQATLDNIMLENIGAASGYLKDAKTAADEMWFVSQAKDTWEKATQWENESDTEFKARKESYRKAYKDLQKAAIRFALTGNTDGLEYTVEEKQRVNKRDSAGNIIIGEYEEKVVTMTKNYANEIANDHDASLAEKKIRNSFEKTMEITNNRVVEYYDQDGNTHVFKFGDKEKDKVQNAEEFLKLGDKSADTEFEVIKKGQEIHKAEAEYAGVKINSSTDKK